MGTDLQSAILHALGLASWQRDRDGVLRVLGSLPAWWARFLPDQTEQLSASAEGLECLRNFLMDAQLFWSEGAAGKIESGIWHYQTADGGTLLLQLHAINAPGASLLVVQDLDATDTSWRDCMLNHPTQLSRIHEAAQRKQLELELRRAKVLAERLERAKAEFFAKTNHEIRTPLASILAVTEMALEQPVNPLQREYLLTTRRSAETLLRIMNDVLDFSQAEQGALAPNLQQFSLRQLLDEFIDDLRPAAAERGIALETRLSEGAEVMRSDPVRLRQILNHLTHNAIRHTLQGSVTIHAAPCPPIRNQGSPRIRFRVEDTGRGIPVEQQRQIFEPFVQLHGHGQTGGIGLGLAIANKLVESLQGTPIRVESEPGMGATFEFTLPRDVVGPAELNSSPDPQSEPPEVDISRLAGLTVLIAEDNEVNRSYLRHVLTNVGMRVLEAENGLQAVDLAQRHAPNLVLMDCRMPECDGIEATRRIREWEGDAHPRLFVIAVTAHAMDEDINRCLAAGMDDYISKPFSKHQLLLKLVQSLP